MVKWGMLGVIASITAVLGGGKTSTMPIYVFAGYIQGKYGYKLRFIDRDIWEIPESRHLASYNSGTVGGIL